MKMFEGYPTLIMDPSPFLEVSHMRRSLMSVAVAISSALVLVSCAMPADDPNFQEGGADFGDDAVSEEQLSADSADALQAALIAPTTIGVDTPLTSVPAAGSLIVSLSDGTDWNGLLNASMAEAAEALGWEFQEIPGAESLESVPAAFEAALALNPAGIRISGEHVAALTSQLAAAETAGIPVICTGCSGAPMGAIRDTSIDGDAQNTEWGSLLASYVVEYQAEGEDAGVEIFTLPAPALQTFNSSFLETLAALCRECPANEAPIDTSDLSFVPDFVAETMSTSLGRWALMDSGAVTDGVASALADALVFEPVVLLGRGASAADISLFQEVVASGALPPSRDIDADLAAGEDLAAEGEVTEGEVTEEFSESPSLATPEQAAALQAWTAFPIPVMGWRVIDQFARILGGEALVDVPLPSQLLTVANISDAVVDDNGNYVGVSDFKQQFLTLWGKE